jgi:hypothetical protein
MSQSRRRLALAAALLALATRPLAAQRAPVLSLGLGLDAESVPDAFSSKCGDRSGGSMGWGANVSLVARPRGVLVVRGDAHVMANALDTGCAGTGHEAPIGGGRTAEWDAWRYVGHVPEDRFATTTLRIGMETPPGAPLVRLLIGGGAVLSGRGALPLGVASLGTGTRGARRLFVEWEYAVSTVMSELPRDIFVAGAAVPVAADTLRLRVWPRWSTLRAGVELPLGGR